MAAVSERRSQHDHVFTEVHVSALPSPAISSSLGFRMQLIARAYHALIPVVSRPLERPRSRPGRNQPTTIRSLRSKAGGA